MWSCDLSLIVGKHAIALEVVPQSHTAKYDTSWIYR